MTARRDDQVMTRLGDMLETFPLEGANASEGVAAPDGMPLASPVQVAQADLAPLPGRAGGRGELVEASQPAHLSVFGTTDAVEIIERASRIATALKEVIVKQHLYATIQGKNYVTVEGWELAGTLLGVFPRLEWTRRIRGGETADYQRDGWEARVSAVHISSENVLGVAEQMCVRDEPPWKAREDYALRGMAQTRATSRALRIPLGFVMKLAGFEATSAEEMRK